MKRILRILSVACLILGAGAVAFAQDKTVDPEDVKELKAIYQEFDAAGKKRDIGIVDKNLDDNFV